jgi:hypothetical protein
MFLNRSDALLLHKVLFHYEKMMNCDQSFGDVLDELSALNEKIEEYLVSDSSQTASVFTQDKSGVQVSSDHDDDDDDDDLDEDETDDAEDGKSQEKMPEASHTLSCSTLHDLPPLETDHGLLEIENEDDEVNLLIDGDFYDDLAVSLVKRVGKSIDIWVASNEKYVFELRKLNKEWKKVLVDGLVYKVIDD